MARTELIAEELQTEINRLEEKQVFSSRTQLCNELCNTKWAQDFPKLTSSMCASRIKEFEQEKRLKLKTPISDHRMSPEHIQKMQEARAAKASEPKVSLGEQYPEWNEVLKVYYPDMLNHVEKCTNGSKASVIRLMCNQCVDRDRHSIKFCTSLSCPLWGHRPIKGTKEEFLLEGIDIVRIYKSELALMERYNEDSGRNKVVGIEVSESMLAFVEYVREEHGKNATIFNAHQTLEESEETHLEEVLISGSYYDLFTEMRDVMKKCQKPSATSLDVLCAKEDEDEGS